MRIYSWRIYCIGSHGTSVKLLHGATMSSSRDFFIKLLKRYQSGESVFSSDGSPKGLPLMSEEEADLRLALFDKAIEPTLDVEIELAQYEAMRWPDSKSVQLNLWRLLEEKKSKN